MRLVACNWKVEGQSCRMSNWKVAGQSCRMSNWKERERK